MTSIVAFIGASGSGKTTLIEYLISHLSKERLKIGTIKHVHHAGFSIDAKGKDTWRHSQAGAKIVVCVAPKETAIIKKGKTLCRNLEEILELVKDEKLDLLLLEGFHSLVAKRQDVFKVITAKGREDIGRTLKGTVDPILAIVGPITQQDVAPSRNIETIVGLGNEREKILELVRTNVLGMQSPTTCPTSTS